MPASPLTGLNPEQLEAARTTEGPLLVLAGAGTGKTRVVISRIAWLLAGGLDPASICAVTFTNKAAREMRERVAAMLGKEPEGMVLSTFHSLGLAILKEFGPRSPRRGRQTIADGADQAQILGDALREVGLSRRVCHPKMARHLISQWKNGRVEPDAALEAAEDPAEEKVAAAYARYEEQMRRQSLYDFDDLVWEPLRLFEQDAGVLAALHSRWSHFFVDEYQDTNACQDDLITALASARKNLCVVGDDDQSIYGWRGADARRILRFKRRWPEAKTVTLDRNYRSRAPILEAANALIRYNLDRHEKALKPELGDGEKIELYVAEDERDELDWLTSRMLFLQARARRSFDEMAVLFRSNAQCRGLEQALREREIPYRVVGTRSFFDRREVRDVLAYFRSAVNVNDDAALLRIINTPARGIGKGSLDKALHLAAEERVSLQAALDRHSDQLSPKARAGWTALRSVLIGLREAPRTARVEDLFDRLLEEVQYKDHLRLVIEDPLELSTRFAALDSLRETLTVTGREGRKDLGEIIDALTLNEEEKARNRNERKDEEKGVTLLTLHAAKGLEFPFVFIVGLEDGLLPHGKSVGEAEDDDHEGAVEEERRLFYVGITRAREKLHLSRSGSRVRFGRRVEADASPFLEEIGLEHFEVSQGSSQEAASEESASAWMETIRQRLRKGGAG